MLYLRDVRGGLGGPGAGQCYPCAARQACAADNVRREVIGISLTTTLGNNGLTSVSYTFLGQTVGRGGVGCSAATAPYLAFTGTSTTFTAQVDPWLALEQGAWASSAIIEVRVAMTFPYGPGQDAFVLTAQAVPLGIPAALTKAGRLPYQPSGCPTAIIAAITVFDDGTLLIT